MTACSCLPAACNSSYQDCGSVSKSLALGDAPLGELPIRAFANDCLLVNQYKKCTSLEQGCDSARKPGCYALVAHAHGGGCVLQTCYRHNSLDDRSSCSLALNGETRTTRFLVDRACRIPASGARSWEFPKGVFIPIIIIDLFWLAQSSVKFLLLCSRPYLHTACYRLQAQSCLPSPGMRRGNDAGSGRRTMCQDRDTCHSALHAVS